MTIADQPSKPGRKHPLEARMRKAPGLPQDDFRHVGIAEGGFDAPNRLQCAAPVEIFGQSDPVLGRERVVAG